MENDTTMDMEKDLLEGLSQAGLTPDPQTEDPDAGQDPATETTDPSEPAATEESDDDSEQPEGQDGVETKPEGEEPGTTDPAAPALEIPKQFLNEDGTPNVAALAKSYKELQAAFTHKAQQVAEAPKFSSPDELDKAIFTEIETRAMANIEAAVGKIANPEHLKEATAALAMYKRTGDIEHIEKARGFLDKNADRRLEVDLRNAAAEVKQDFNARRDEIELAPVAQDLQALEEEDPAWIADPVHQDILVAAIKLNRKVDVKSIKQMVDKIGENAVKKYVAAEEKKKAVEVNKKQEISLKGGNRVDQPKPKKAFHEMTIEEQLAEEYSSLK